MCVSGLSPVCMSQIDQQCHLVAELKHYTSKSKTASFEVNCAVGCFMTLYQEYFFQGEEG